MKREATIHPDRPAIILAPMDAVTDSPMRALQGEIGAFDFAVSEFIRVSTTPVPEKVFHREIPELLTEGLTSTGLPVQAQLLGGSPELMAESARNACLAGARSLDINFGCPAPTVNRHDGGASILRCPERVRTIVEAVREAVPSDIPVSAKVRLGWSDITEIDAIADMATEGGASWLVVHARTKLQKYAPPVSWKSLGRVRKRIGIPLVANGDIWTIEDFHRCREQSGCLHYMLGRGVLADPRLVHQIAEALGLKSADSDRHLDWVSVLRALSCHSQNQIQCRTKKTLHRLKQWLNMARRFGDFPHFDAVKRTQTQEEFFEVLERCLDESKEKISAASVQV
jgi:tRNA-dihydrouridine synthase C